MEKVEEIIGLLIELSDSELDAIKLKITEIKRSRKNVSSNKVGNSFNIKFHHREKMIKFNPFLAGKI